MAAKTQAILLLADSRPLFSDEIRDVLKGKSRAAYIGAANGDQPEFYELFRGAMNNLGIEQCVHVHARPSDEEWHFLKQADFVLLSGGDVIMGISALLSGGFIETIRERFVDGCMLAGVSAGAIHLGKGYWNESAIAPCIGLIPFFIDVHADKSHWSGLKKTLLASGDHAAAWGLSKNSFVCYNSDGSLDIMHGSVREFVSDGKSIKENILLQNRENA